MELNLMMVKERVREYYRMRNYSKETEKGAMSVLNCFDGYLTKKTGIKDYREVVEKSYYEYLEYLTEGRKTKKSTSRYHGSVLKKIFGILEEEELILYNPFLNVKTIKVERSIRDKVLSEEEINELLGVADMTSAYGYRDRVILEVLYGAGIRASELMNLELTDFLTEDRLILIRNTKGRKDRIIPLGEHVYGYLNEYVKKIRNIILKRKKSKYIFVTSYGGKLTENIILKVIKKIVRKTKKEKKVTPHVFRHTFATHLLKRGAGIRQIQELLGHKCISSTMVYINLNQSYLKDEYEKYHPLENEIYFDINTREEKAVNGKLEVKHIKVKRKN